MSDERHNVAFMVGIILGALGGAVATLWLTPLSGTQTREQLAARLAGLTPGGPLPTHLDQGTYATEAWRGPAARESAGPGEVVTFSAAVNAHARQGIERLEAAETAAEATAPPVGSEGGSGETKAVGSV